MKKIAITGGHGVGKTTLCRALMDMIEASGQRGILVGEVIRHSPYPINDGMSEKTAMWAMSEQVRMELEAEAKDVDYVICDRTAYDPAVYLAYIEEDGLDELCAIWPTSRPVDHMVAVALSWLSTYHKIVLIKGFDPKQLKDDGVRSQNVDFGIAMDDMFQDIFSENMVDFDVESNEVFAAGVSRLCKKILQ